MPFVEGVRGPDPIRWCEHCGVHQLLLVGSYFHRNDLGIPVADEPMEYSHLPTCPVCADKIAKGELCHAYSENPGVDCLQPFGHEGNHGDPVRARVA